MTQRFEGYEVVSESKNFLITCVDDPAARERAQYLSYTCEADLTRLEQIFGTNFQTVESHDYTTWVNVVTPLPGATANGMNFGYQRDQSSRIIIMGAYTPQPGPPFPPDPPLPGLDENRILHDFARRVFVVELSEILMGFTGYGWDEMQSHGEGLSEIVGAEFYPEAYYGAGLGPRIYNWLNGIAATATAPAEPGRVDWVSKTEGTDKNSISYGCAILFINYLIYQLDYSLERVVAAGSDTLANTYARLTGNPAAQAFRDFSGLIASHAPAGQPINPSRDNIFPLRDPGKRALFTQQGLPTVIHPARDANPQSFKVKPGLICPADLYEFYVDRELIEVSEYIRAFGFMSAVFGWSINGIALPVRNHWDTLTLTIKFATRTPDGKISTTTTAVDLRYIVVDTWNKTALFVKNTSMPGNCSLAISVAAREQALPNEPTMQVEDSLDMTIIFYTAGERLKKDRKRCNVEFVAVDDRVTALVKVIQLFKNLPDPPPVQTVVRALEAARQVEEALAKASHSSGLTRAELLREFRMAGPIAPAAGVSESPTEAAAKPSRTNSKGKPRRPIEVGD